MAVVSRLQLDHPALGTAGGAPLHTSIEAIYTKIGDNMADRFFTLSDFDQAETVELNHNFDANQADLRVELWRDTGSGLEKITSASTPAESDFSIVEKTGDETNILEITNNTAGDNLEVIVVIFHDPIELHDLTDTNLAAPEDGQAVVYDGVTSKWIAGASGDSSFKLQSVTDPNATIKGGFLIDNAGREYATYDGVSAYGGDLTVSLDTILGGNPTDDTTYYLYIDRDLVGAAATEAATGRKLLQVTESELALLTGAPDTVDLTRYIPIGLVHSADTGTVWSGTGSEFRDLARRNHVGADLVRYDTEFTSTPGATLPHGLGQRPDFFAVLHNELADGQYVPLDPSNYLKADDTNIYTSGFGSLTIDGTHQLRIVAFKTQRAADVSLINSNNYKPSYTAYTTGPQTAANGEQILANTSAGVFTINLPASPSAGDRVTIYDSGFNPDAASGGWATNNLTVGRNSSNIEGNASDLTADVDGARLELVYVGATIGWKVY